MSLRRIGMILAVSVLVTVLAGTFGVDSIALGQASPLKDVGYSPNLHEKVFSLADESGPDATEGQRVLVAPLAKTRKWAVVELLEVEPIYHGDFEMQREELEQQAAWIQGQVFYQAWFDPENILRRAGYVAAVRPEP